MPAKDIYHEQVKNALVKDGWAITHDPYIMTFGQTGVYADLGAERALAAEKGNEKIVVEVKSFQGASAIHDLENAVGQYVFYRSLLVRFEPGRKLFLAVPESIFTSTLNEPIVRPVIEDLEVAIIAFNPQKEEIVKWTK
jgi:hypothetical protein